MIEKLEKLLDLLRAKGVTEFEGDGVKVKFGPLEPVLTPAQEADAVKKDFKKMLASKPRGLDGLTYEEQVDLYGTVMDEIAAEPGDPVPTED